MSIEQDLNERTHEQMNKSQKEFFLREQLKVIQGELGEYDDGFEEFQDYRKKLLEALHLAPDIREKLMRSSRA